MKERWRGFTLLSRFVHQIDQDIEMGEFLRLMQSSGFLFADEIETGAGIEDFDVGYFKRFYEQYYTEKVEDINVSFEKLLETEIMTGNR